MVKNDSFTIELVTVSAVGCPIARFGYPARDQPRDDVPLRRKQLYLEVAGKECSSLANARRTPDTCTACTRGRSPEKAHIHNICTSVFLSAGLRGRIPALCATSLLRLHFCRTMLQEVFVSRQVRLGIGVHSPKGPHGSCSTQPNTPFSLKLLSYLLQIETSSLHCSRSFSKPITSIPAEMSPSTSPPAPTPPRRQWIQAPTET